MQTSPPCSGRHGVCQNTCRQAAPGPCINLPLRPLGRSHAWWLCSTADSDLFVWHCVGHSRACLPPHPVGSAARQHRDVPGEPRRGGVAASGGAWRQTGRRRVACVAHHSVSVERRRRRGFDGTSSYLQDAQVMPSWPPAAAASTLPCLALSRLQAGGGTRCGSGADALLLPARLHPVAQQL